MHIGLSLAMTRGGSVTPTLSELILSDASWTWFNHPQAVYDAASDLTLFGGVTANGRLRVGKFNHATGRMQSSILESSITQQDDHYVPALVRLADDDPTYPGLYLWGYSTHNGAAYSKRALAANSITLLGSRVNVVAGGHPAYCLLYQMLNDDRTVYFFERMDSFLPGGADWGRAFKTSDDGGDTWSSETEFFGNGANRPYPWQYQTADGLTIHWFMGDAHPTTATNNIYHFTMTVDATTGARTWATSDGTPIGTGDSELPLAAADVTQVYDGSTTNSWLWDAAEVESAPTCAFATRSAAATPTDWATTHTYKISRYEGGSWATETVCDGGGTGADGLYAGEPAYSGGICLDHNDKDVCYVSRKYGSTDFRIEKWERIGTTWGSGTWEKSANISGATSSVNARPRRVEGSNPTQILYWRGTYTSYTNYAADVYAYPKLNIVTPSAVAKPSSPAWQGGDLSAGVNHYYPVHEGTGTTVTDLVTSGAKNGSFTGTPTWSVNTPLGAQLGGFSTSNYVAIDPAAQPIATGAYPWWFAVLVTNTSSAAQGWPISFGRNSSGNTTVGFRLNEVANRVGAFVRDDAGTGTASLDYSSSPINDGNPHVLMWIQLAANRGDFFFDGALVSSSSSTLGTITLNQMSLGVLRRNSVGNPHTGFVLAAACGEGDVPDPGDFSDDWIYGVFAAVRP